MEKEEGVVRNEGIDRRRLLKRGAVVGGTLLWAAPLIQTIGPAAQAHRATGSPRFTCCECSNCGFSNFCTADGPEGGGAPFATTAGCAQWCADAGCSGSEFHSGPDNIACDAATGQCNTNHP